MKRYLIPCLLLLLVLLAGCGQQPAAGFSQADLTLTVAGEAFDCDTNITQVIEKLGEGYEYAEGKSCAYDGLDKTYAYSEVEFFTNPLAEGDIVTEIYTESPSVTTSKGLTVGASRQEVLDTYGQPDEDDGYILTYRVSEEPGEPPHSMYLMPHVV